MKKKRKRAWNHIVNGPLPFGKTARIGKRNLKCPYCGEKAELVNSKEVYGKDFGKMWICGNYPKCDSYVGCHKGTIAPLGTIANKELREKRKVCHFAFDALWKKYNLRRTDAYRWLSRKLELNIHDTHIGMFDINMCNRMIEIIKRGELMEAVNGIH